MASNATTHNTTQPTVAWLVSTTRARAAKYLLLAVNEHHATGPVWIAGRSRKGSRCLYDTLFCALATSEHSEWCICGVYARQ